MNEPFSPEKVVAALEIVRAVAECIRVAGEVPSGHLYAQVMDKLCLNDFQSVIRTLVNAKLVEEKGHILVWIGPKT